MSGKRRTWIVPVYMTISNAIEVTTDETDTDAIMDLAWEKFDPSGLCWQCTTEVGDEGDWEEVRRADGTPDIHEKIED